MVPKASQYIRDSQEFEYCPKKGQLEGLAGISNW